MLRRVFIILLLMIPFLPFDSASTDRAASLGMPLFCVKAARGEEAISMRFDEMYDGISTRYGIMLSEKLKNADGKMVTMEGFMAPPLTPTINFFVLTSRPMSLCPFCSSDADWPDDIVVVKLREPVKALPYDRPIMVTGILELGHAVDEETGFVSLVRIDSKKLAEVK